MLRLIFVAAALFLLLIPHAAAQTSLALLKSDPARYFPAVKTAMQVVYDHTEKKQAFHGKTEKKQPYHGKHDLDVCTERKMFLSEAYDGADPLEFNAVDVAYLMVFWSNDLRRLGYPANVWQSLFDDFEQKALPMLVAIARQNVKSEDHPTVHGLEKAEEDFANRRKGALDRYRAKRPSLPIIVPGEEGGRSGTIGVQFVPQQPPSPTEVMIVPVFNYQFCVAMRKDPHDFRDCEGWREVLGEEPEAVAGEYCYSVLWSDGVKRTGSVRMDNKTDGEKISLKRPQVVEGAKTGPGVCY